MLCTRQKDNGPFASFDRIKIILFVFTSNNFIVYVQTLLSDIIHERKYKIHDGVRIRYDFSSGYANFNFELTGEGTTGPESNVSPTIAF